MITYHPSADGSADYLDFHTPDGDRFYLPRHEMRSLLAGLLVAVGEDVVCGLCGRLNGVHQVRNDGRSIQRCAGAGATPRPEDPESPYKDIGLSSLWELRSYGREYIDGVHVSSLTEADPEPPPGTTIEMESGQRWTRYPDMAPGSWLVAGGEADSDPETWLKVAGNYGPVRIVRPAPCVPGCPVPLSPCEEWTCPTCSTKWRVS